MPPRPAVKGKEGRPVSAIYLGSGNKQASSSNSGNGASPTQPQTSSSSPHPANGPSANLPEVPDLPEPPSPSSSVGSGQSGLPSPPATNSTGSGSTGDPGSVARRQRPLSFASESSASTSSSTHKAMSVLLNRGAASSGSRSSSRLADNHDPEDEDDDDDNDGDHTARLNRLNHVKSSSENARALQRAMSLTQRNKMAIDKLSRLGSPSPRSRSPSHASTTSSSRLRQVRTVSQPVLPDTGHSGSETERESTSLNAHSTNSQSSSSHASSSRRPITPTSNAASSNTFSPPHRLRHISAPGSPNHARLLTAASGGSNLSNSPTSRRRKRASMATMTSITQTYEDEEEEEPANDNHYGAGRDRLRNDTIRDITQSALAAVASSRRSPLGARRRGALPREFREDLSNNTNAPDTASVTSDARTRRSEDFDSRPHRLSIEPMTPYRNNGVGRSATVREVRRSGAPSRLGEDYLRPTTPEQSPTDASKRERRQALRGGSAESALRSPTRTLLGEGLRAAGLTRRDVQRADRGDPGPRSADLFHHRRVDSSPTDVDNNIRRRTMTYGRSATSMGDYGPRHEADELEGREHRIRTHRSTYSLVQDGEPSAVRENRELSLTRQERDQLPLVKAPLPHATAQPQPAKAIPQHLQERYLTASPLGTNRQSTPAPGSAEHGRLMVESMALFESTVAKLPSVVTGISSLGSIPSSSTLVKNAQVLVHAAERVNELMRAGTTRALEEQINAEVEGNDSASAQEMLEVWRQVGGEYREGLRASDELVRALTSFLMDTGSIMRKLASAPAVSEIGSPAVHGRSISLDEEAQRSQPRLGDGSDGGSGRESRRSWEPSQREREREEALRKLAGGTSGRESSLSLARASASPTILALRDRDRLGYETPSPASSSRPLPSTVSSNPVRRLFTPREHLRPLDPEEQRPSVNDTQPTALQPSDSQKTLQAESVEPSPTPVSRTIGRDRSRTLPPLPPLPSEPARRIATSTKLPATRAERPESTRDRTHERRKPSVASVSTVRGSGPTFSSLTTPSSASTVITHHTVSSSPEVARSNSDRSVRSTVTFSTPSSASSAALSDIHQQAIDDERRRGSDHQQETPGPSSSVFKTPARAGASSMARAKSVSETVQRRTVGTRTPRTSLDGEAGAADGPSVTKNSTAHAADRSAVLTALPGMRKEKRRTVTDIFPQQ